MQSSAPTIGTRNKYTSVFIPLEWQVKPWHDKSLAILLTGSAGGGKTDLAAEKIHGFMQRYPGACALVGRKAREWCAGSVRMALEKAIGDDKRVQSFDDRIDYWNGSRIYYFGMFDKKQQEAMRSKKGRNGDPDIAWMEEANAFTREDYDEIAGRLRGGSAPWTQLIMTTNPDTPTHWIYRDLIQGGGASVYYSGAMDNKFLPASYYKRLDEMVGVKRLRLRDGKWVQAEGVIYDEFNPDVHIIDADKCPEFVRRFRVIDFGYTNPFVCQWWGEDFDGRLYRYREIYQTKQLVEDMAKKINALTGTEYIETTIADHDAEDRATLAKYGIHTIAAQKDVASGINAVKQRLSAGRLFFVRGALVEPDPLLVEDKKPLCTEDEIIGYSWQKYADGKPNKEQPVKVNDHGMDTTRYMAKHSENRVDPSKLVDFA